MHVIHTTVYNFDELEDSAKEKAREWYREGGFDYEWWDSTYDDAKQCAALIGIEIDKINFSGFWSQGDGACFTGRYSYKKGGVAAIMNHAPKDSDLHTIAEELRGAQWPQFFQLSAVIEHGHHAGNYSHPYTVDIRVDHDGFGNGWRDITDNESGAEQIRESLRDFMNWIYRRLESEWEYMNAGEQIDETIRANEYTFTAEGAREG